MKKVIYLAKNYIYINENDKILKKEFSFEKGVVTTTIGYNNILNINFKLPKDIDKELLYLEAEKYLFKEGSLSYEKEYKIVYKFKEFDDFYNVEAFIVEIEVLKKEFNKYIQTFKYIDFISAKPFVFKSFYDINKTVFKKDAFIYFSEKESFLSCFENGKFIFVKSLNKFESLVKKMSLTNKEVIDLLNKNGLNEESYENKESFKIIESFFAEFFMRVSNLLNYSSNYYNLKKIDRIYFYSTFNINGLFQKYESFWNLSEIEFKKYEINSGYDAFDYTALIYNLQNYLNKEENFTIFIRPLPFYKTKTGQLAIFLFIGLLMVSIDAYLKHQKILKRQQKIAILNKQILKNRQKSNLLSKKIKTLQNRVKKLKTENIALKNKILDIEGKFRFLKNIQFNKLTTNEIVDIVNGLSRYNLKLLFFNKVKSRIELEVVSKFKNSSKVASFMKYLSSLGYKNIQSNEIKYKNSLYILKVSYDS